MVITRLFRLLSSCRIAITLRTSSARCCTSGWIAERRNINQIMSPKPMAVLPTASGKWCDELSHRPPAAATHAFVSRPTCGLRPSPRRVVDRRRTAPRQPGKRRSPSPELLLLDEPGKGVDIGAKAEIHALIRAIVADGDVAVVVVSTEEEELIGLADAVCVFKNGSCDGTKYPQGSVTSGDLRRLAWPSSSEATTDSA
jgi:hypothetical protein